MYCPSLRELDSIMPFIQILTFHVKTSGLDKNHMHCIYKQICLYIYSYIHVTVHFINYFQVKDIGIRQLLPCTHSYMLKYSKK